MTMNCPLCQTELKATVLGRFETLGEHVSDPNGIVLEKQGYGCTNIHCNAYKVECVWLKDGEGPFGGKLFNLNQFAWNEGIPMPRGTWHYEYKLSQRKSKDSIIRS